MLLSFPTSCFSNFRQCILVIKVTRLESQGCSVIIVTRLESQGCAVIAKTHFFAGNNFQTDVKLIAALTKNVSQHLEITVVKLTTFRENSCKTHKI